MNRLALPFRCGRKLRPRHGSILHGPSVSSERGVRASAVKPPSPAIKESKPDQSWFLSESGQKQWVDAMEIRDLADNLPERLSELGLNYDPEVLAGMFADRRGELSARAVEVTGALSMFFVAIMRDWATGSLEQNVERRGKELTRLLTRLGPSFVKLGQALSLRPDLLPREYLEALSELQDGLEPFHSDIAFTVIEQELGKPLEQVYSHITATPVAAASLGQVYKATLASTGETVAVKVQRPGIGQSIAIDMLLLRRLLKLIDESQDLISQELVPLVDEFAARLFGELDYVQEGKNCERFTALYKDVPRIRTPAIYWDCTSRRVLTMEWVDGVKLTDAATLEARGQSVVDFVDVGIECTLRQLLEHGYFHADPHPGNLLATQDGDLCYLDFGMMSEAPEYARTAIIAHVVHLVNRDYEAMCQDYYTLQFMDPAIDTSPIAPSLAAFFDTVLDKSVSELNFKAIVDGLGAVLFEYPFQVPAYYALILRSLTVLEGVALSADRDYKLLAKAYPYMAQRLLLDPNPELRTTFQELMLKGGEFRWNRLEQLLQQSRMSAAFKPEQAWLITDWFLSPAASQIRDKVIHDLVRMADAAVAASVRQQVEAQSGSSSLAQRMVPLAANEGKYADLARRLEAALVRPDGPPAPFAVNQLLPSGLPDPSRIKAFVDDLIQQVDSTLPRVRSIALHPVVRSMIAEFTLQAVQRVAARSVKFAFAGVGLPQGR